MTPYDWLLARRTSALGLLLGILALAVMVATDETTNTLGGRLGRFAAVAPLVGAGATFLSAQQARLRGEARALEAVGATPLRASLGLLLGGVAVAALGPLLASLPAVDLGTLFPTAGPVANQWSLQDGAWHDLRRGLAVAANGSLAWTGAPGVAGFEARSAPRAATAFSLAIAAVGCPLWTATEGGGYGRPFVAALAVSCGVVAFHLVAVGRLSPLALAVPPVMLVIDALVRARSAIWS